MSSSVASSRESRGRVYEYDVFISYKRRGGNVPGWVSAHFHPMLAGLLDDFLGREPKIFFDGSLRGGAIWPGELRTALLRSRILIAVCSPGYFQDEWCLAEWYSMVDREKLTGTPPELIYPVLFCDSRNFPDWAHERRMQDLKTWNQPYPQFQQSEDYLGFHREMSRIAEELTDLFDLVPQWQPDWPVNTPVPEPARRSRIPRF